MNYTRIISLVTILACSISACYNPAQAGVPSGLNPGWTGLDTVSGNLALEVKLGYRIGSNELFYAQLWNDGKTNIIDGKVLLGSKTGVSIVTEADNVDSGQVFGLGDWCIGSQYAVVPYIKDFNINVLRYNFGTGAVATVQIPDSQANQFTSTDCFTLNGGAEMVVAANNFDLKELNYFRSTDDGSNWNLELRYNITAGITDAFAGGFRDTHGAIDDQLIGSTYQRGDGILESVALDWDGSVLGLTNMGDHNPFVGNGFLKEMDGIVNATHAVGIANGGTAIAVGAIDLADGGFDFTLSNSVVTGDVFPFQGVSVSPGLADEYHFFSNRHTRVVYNGGIGTAEPIVGFPFADNGGPVDSAASSELARIFVAGIYSGSTGGTDAATPSGAAGPVTAVATLDPAAAVAGAPPPDGGGPAAIPALDWRAMILFGMFLLLLGWLAIRRGFTS